jgi:hypothetical protein
MISKGISYGGVLAVAVLGVAYFYSDTDGTLNRFGEAVTERLCDILPATKREATTEEATTAAPATLSKESVFNPKVSNGGVYNAKKAMDARYRQLKEVCHKYSDVLRPETIIGLQVSLENPSQPRLFPSLLH